MAENSPRDWLILPGQKDCNVCGRPMAGRTDKATCSDACRMKAYRKRKRDNAHGN